MRLEVTIDGELRRMDVDPDEPLWPLIDPIGVERGACGSGACMRCAVLVSGRVMPACIVPAYRAADAEILTPAGLAGDRLHDTIMRAFERVGLTRCTEALPAMVMVAYQAITEGEASHEDRLQRTTRYLPTRCVSRDEFERAVRLADRVHARRRSERQGT